MIVDLGKSNLEGNGNEYSYQTPFGTLQLANYRNSLIYASFSDTMGLNLTEQFPHIRFQHESHPIQLRALSFFQKGFTPENLSLGVQGTEFQRRVWQELLFISPGYTQSYQDIAKKLGSSRYSQAIGNAAGANLIACIIPCHRLVRSDGQLAGYRWGVQRKKELLRWEKSQLTPEIPF